jgi:hypothetical protein
MFASNRYDRTGLVIATLIFALVFLGQLWRLIAHVPVAINGMEVSTGLTVFACLVALVMTIWMGNIWKHSKPSA